MILHRDELCPAMLLSDVQCLLELPRPHGRGADVTSLACPHNIIQRFHRLFDRSLVIPAMDLVEVDVIRLKPLQAVLDLPQDRLARQSASVWFFTHFAVDLGGNDDLVPLREVP